MTEWVRHSPVFLNYNTREEAAHLSDEQWARLEAARAAHAPAYEAYLVNGDRRPYEAANAEIGKLLKEAWDLHNKGVLKKRTQKLAKKGKR